MISCSVCYETYPKPGTEHALYSARCSHLVGVSCLDHWRQCKPENELTCPFCYRLLNYNEYYPILGLKVEFNIPRQRYKSYFSRKTSTEENIMKKCLSDFY